MMDRASTRLINNVYWAETDEKTAKVHREKLNTFYEDLVFSALDTGVRKGRALDLGTQFGLCGLNLAKQDFDFEITSLQDTGQQIKRSMGFAEQDMTDGKMNWALGTPESLPFEDRTFDLIISGFSMHHWENPLKAMSEISRVMKIKGTVLIADFRRDAFSLMAPVAKSLSYLVKHDRLYDQIKSAYEASYTRHEAERLAEESGLKNFAVTKDVQFIYVKKAWKEKDHVMVKITQ